MDVKKEPKEVKFIDVNQAMNNLLTKVAEAIVAPDGNKKQALEEIQNLLVDLKQADKTSQYVLSEETISKVRKAISDVELPDDKSLKSIGVETSTPEKTFKIDDAELPTNAEEAREKINNIVNENLDKTIKAIGDIISITEGEEKGLLEVPSEGESTGKILTDILVTLLGKSLKGFTDVAIPTSTEAKNDNEVNISDNINRKSISEIDDTEVVADKTLEENELETLEPEFNKEAESIEYAEDPVQKQTFGIGQFPVTRNKLEDNELEYAAAGEDKPNLNSEDLPEIATADLLGIKETNDLIVSPGDDKEEYISGSDSPGMLNILTGVTTQKDLVPQPTVDENGEINTPLTPSQAIDKDELETAFSTEIGTGKPRTPTEWYKAWMLGRAFNGSRQDNLSDSELSLAGVTLQNDGALAGAANFLGDALSFFGITTADIGRFVNSQIRNFNTIANAFELTVATTSIEAQRPSRAGNNLGRIVRSFIDFGDLEAPDNLNKETGAVRLSEFGPGGESIPEALRNFSDRGKLTGNQTSRTQGGDDSVYNIGDISIASPGIIKPNSGRENEKLGGNDASATYAETYKARTTEIINGLSVPGFLKVYTKRGPRFGYSQNEVHIIPFQFDPEIGGDSKNADYSTVATLGRSQAAQVYKYSGERQITLELTYLIVNQPDDVNRYINDSKSLTATGMNTWTEEYVYGYVVRNFRNLTLPNIIGPRYKLAPPIVQVWYGGIDQQSASSTGVSSVKDPDNTKLNNIHPAFRTNWYTHTGEQSAYRSLWICSGVSFEYEGGYISSDSRNKVQVNVSISLTEIAPSVTDNEVMLWSKIQRATG